MIEDRDKILCIGGRVSPRASLEIMERKRFSWPKVYYRGRWRISREVSLCVGGSNMIELTLGRRTLMGKVYGIGVMLRGHMAELSFRYKNYNKKDEQV